MAVANYIARVDERGALTFPKEVQEALQLQPGEEVQVSIHRVPAVTATPNQKMLSILDNIRERHNERNFTDPSDTDKLLREARSGAMYSDDRAE